MRGFAAIPISILFSIAAAASALAQGAPDAAALTCAWDKLPAAEQTRLRDEFQVKLLNGSFTIHFGALSATGAADAARDCQLNLTPPQVESLAVVLSRRAAVEKAKAGIAARGDDPALIQAGLAKMHDGKRERIGDKLSCPGPHSMVKEWDESVKGAMRRAQLRFNNSGTYAWISLGLYANMAEEGAVRRLNGGSAACD
jgi:hypothetical protein